MNALSIIPAATAASLKSFDDSIPDEVNELIFQAPAANTAIINFGSSAVQPFEVPAGDPFFSVPATRPDGRIDTTLLFVKGNGANAFSVSWVGHHKVK